MQKKILFVMPSSTNEPVITGGISILSGVAKKCMWDVELFDSYQYDTAKVNKESYFQAKEMTGEIMPLKGGRKGDTLLPFEELVIDLQDKINIFEPSIIAVSFTSYEYGIFLSFWKKIKVPLSTLIICGGYHAVIAPDEVISSKLFSMVVIGEGEEVVKEILNAYEHGKDLSKIDGTFFYDKIRTQICRNQRKELIDKTRLWQCIPDDSLYLHEQKYFLIPSFNGKTC